MWESRVFIDDFPLLIHSLQIKIDNPKKREEYLEALIEINDMPSSGDGFEVTSHQSLDKDIAKAVDKMMDR